MCQDIKWKLHQKAINVAYSFLRELDEEFDG